MTKTDTLKVTTPSDREIAMIRSFASRRRRSPHSRTWDTLPGAASSEPR